MRTVTVSSKSRAGGRTRRAQAPRPSPTPGGERAWGLRLRPGDGGARARAGASVPDPPVTDPSAACPLLGAWDQPSQPRFRCGLLCSDTQAGVAPAGPGRSRWPSSMAVTEDRGRWSPAPPEAFPLAAPVGPGRRPRSEGVPAWSAQGQTVATREPRFCTLREPRRAPSPCQLQGCGCSPAKGETVNDDNHHELAPRRRAHLRSRRPSPRHGAAERTKHSRPPAPSPGQGEPPARTGPAPHWAWWSPATRGCPTSHHARRAPVEDRGSP